MKRVLRKVVACVMALVLSMSLTQGLAYAEETRLVERNAWDGETTVKSYETDEYKITFSLNSYWDGGYNANVEIVNSGENAIENWCVCFDLTQKIANVWNAQIVQSQSGYCVIKNAGWNQDIPAGGSVSFGLNVNESFSGFPNLFRVLGECVEVNKDAYSVEYILDSDWGNGFTGRIIVTNNSEETIEDWSIEFDFLREITEIWNGQIEVHAGNHYVIKNAEYNSNIEPKQSITLGFMGGEGNREDSPYGYTIHSYRAYGESMQELDYKDSDEDGLLNFYEDAIGTNKYNSDTDGDGLPDGYEVFTLQSYPYEVDSDFDGIVDGDEDDDGDGLSNSREYELVINPKDIDTDGDGLLDALELAHGMNPNDQDTLDDGIYDGERIYSVEYESEASDNSKVRVYLQIDLKGNQIDSLSVNKITDDSNFLNSNIPGYLGNGYSLNVDGTFDEAMVSFELSNEIINNSKLNPTLYYWNEEIQLLEEVANQYIEGNKIIAKLNHFSDYIVLVKDEYEREAFRYEIAAPINEELVNTTFDVAFVLDESGSISHNDFGLMKERCIELITNLDARDRIAVITFDDIVRKKTTFTNKEDAIATLRTLSQNNGDTAIYDAINVAEDEFVNFSSKEKTKIIILLTDGVDNESSNSIYDIVQKANENDIVIYTIGIGSENGTALNQIAKNTNGSYYSIDVFAQLESVFERIKENADLYKDSDNDGLSDYYEKKIASGEMHNGSGQALEGCSLISYLNPDSDGDGLWDGDEIEIRELLAGSNFYCYLYANPCLVDSDSDGYDDYVEMYIGTSPIRKVNVVAEKSELLENNTWAEWKEMVDLHSWNYIHNLVQEDVVARYMPTITKEFFIVGVGRADLTRHTTKEIWEVKPTSYSVEPKKSLGLAQLERYTTAVGYRNGGSSIVGRTFNTPDKQYSITYTNLNNGLVVYNFKKNEPVKVPVTEKETVKEPGYVYEPKISEDDIVAVGILAAIVIIGGTIIEDIATGGWGIWNDVPSITFAISLLAKGGA